MNKFKTYFTVFCFIVYVVTIIMLISYSIETGTQSIQSSNGVSNAVGSVIETIAPDKVNTKRPEFASLIRKLIGHFGLFAANCFFGLISFYLIKTKKFTDIIIAGSVGVFLSAFTEFLQLITEDRNSTISDVFINLGGCLFGLIISQIFILIGKKIHNRNTIVA